MQTYNSFNELATANSTPSVSVMSVFNSAYPKSAKEFFALKNKTQQEYAKAKNAWYSQQDRVFDPKDEKWECRFNSKIADFNEMAEKAKLEELGNQMMELRQELEKMEKHEEQMLNDAWKSPYAPLAYAGAIQ